MIRFLCWTVFATLLGGADTPKPPIWTLEANFHGVRYLIQVAPPIEDRNCEPKIVSWATDFNIIFDCPNNRRGDP
jgi:hypothetical protein